MKSIRLNREKKIENDLLKVKIGTTNKENPRIVYVDGRVFISPTVEMKDYTDEIEDIRKRFKKNIGKHLKYSNLFDNRFILNFDISSSRMIKDKRSFLSFQFYLKQKETTPLPINVIKSKGEGFINSLISSLVEDVEEHNFTMYKTRK